jgi:hypothetical protein
MDNGLLDLLEHNYTKGQACKIKPMHGWIMWNL